MQPYGNVYDQYREQSINTMTQGEMLVLLYDEIIKRLNRSKIFLQNRNYEDFEANVVRAKEIILYFEQTLDHKYEISANLQKLYEFMTYQLTRSQIGRRVDHIDEVLPMVVELRDTWKEADRLSRLK